MGPIKLIFFALRIFLAVGLSFGYAAIVRDMAVAAVRARSQHSFSAAKFNRLLWSHNRTTGDGK